jgi:protein gp37
MSDLFHEAFTWEQVVNVLTTIALCPQHTFIVLTKRPDRARLILSDKGVPSYAGLAVHRYFPLAVLPLAWPLPNLWLGVTVENGYHRDRLIDLRETPAARRFVCCEPLLGPLPELVLDGIDWVIVGGETGPGARLMRPEWALDVYLQCKAAGVPFWWKQGGKVWDEQVIIRSRDTEDVAMMATRELPAVAS